MGGNTAFEAPSAPCANCLFPGRFPRRDTEEMGVLVRPGRGEPVCLKAGRKQHLGSPSGRWRAVPCDLCAASAACIGIPADLSHAAAQRRGRPCALGAWRKTLLSDAPPYENKHKGGQVRVKVEWGEAQIGRGRPKRLILNHCCCKTHAFSLNKNPNNNIKIKLYSENSISYCYRLLNHYF